MKFYSEETKKIYDSEDELKKAEKELKAQCELEKRKKEERSIRAKEVEDAFKNYVELRDKFIEDYGNYHMTITSKSPGFNSIFDYLDTFLFQ